MARRLPWLLGVLLFAGAPGHAADTAEGRWINPRGTVVVTTSSCRDKLCGRVSWASDKAIADAAAAGASRLVGTEILQDYQLTAPGRWAGRVYVPDMGRTFSSTIEQIDTDRLKISGCVVGGLICKSQIWRRHPEGN